MNLSLISLIVSLVLGGSVVLGAPGMGVGADVMGSGAASLEPMSTSSRTAIRAEAKADQEAAITLRRGNKVEAKGGLGSELNLGLQLGKLFNPDTTVEARATSNSSVTASATESENADANTGTEDDDSNAQISSTSSESTSGSASVESTGSASVGSSDSLKASGKSEVNSSGNAGLHLGNVLNLGL